MTEVVLKPTRNRSIRRRHPWILSGAIDRIEGAEEPGGWLRVWSAEGEVLGFGHLSPRSALRVRMLTVGKEAPDDELVAAVLREATGAGVGFERGDASAARCEGMPTEQGPRWTRAARCR